ncbi:MAG: PKD domain-containing protein [Bacteroidetes bacterium]|nr:PKD domain-containing protein [Bacteroidota bacterium]
MKSCLRIFAILALWVFSFSDGFGGCATIDFKADVYKGCNPLIVKFSALNFTSGTTFEWDFGGGFVNGKDTIYKIFTATGKYTIKMRATLSNGTVCSTITKSNLIEVLAAPVPYIAVIPGKILCSGTHKITFIDSTVGSASRDWVINGKSTLNGGKSITDSFNSIGTKSLVVKVTNSSGCSAVFSDNNFVTVTDSAAADFCANIKETKSSITVDFSPAIYCPNRSVSSYNWSFGSGTPSSSTTSSPSSVSFPKTGNYDVSLTVKLSDGCVFTKKITSFVQPFMSANKDSACINELVMLTNKVKTSNRTGFAWGLNGTESNDSARFTATGLQDFALNYTYPGSKCGNKVICPKCIKVKGPKAEFSSSSRNKCNIGDTMHIKNTSDEFGAGKVTYTWVIRDTFGKIYSGAKLLKPTGTNDLDIIFPKYGVWSLKLYATGTTGCTDTTLTMKKYLVLLKPKADFKPDTNIICTEKNIQLKNLTYPPDDKNNPYKYQWIIQHSDSAPVVTTLTIKTPSFQPSLPGEYDVTLIVESSKGCADTLIKKRLFKVNGQIVELQSNKSVGCPPLSVNLNAVVKMKYPNTATNVQKYTWTVDPATGNTMTKTNDSTVKVDITAGGCYAIKIVLKDSNQCTASDQKGICVGSGATFTVDKPKCLGQPVNISNSANPTPDKFKWTVFPSAHAKFSPNDSAPNPTITFNKDTIYKITLSTVKTSNGLTCTGTDDTLMYVGGVKPFITSNTSTAYCAPSIITFYNYSQNANKYHWDFGDGSTSNTDTQKIVSHLYTKNNPSGFKITVDMQDSTTGCTFKYVHTTPIKVIGPAPKFYLSAKKGCDSVYVTIADSSKNVKSFIFNYDDGSAQLSNAINPHMYKLIKANLDSQIFYPVMVAVDAKNCKNFHKDTVKLYRSYKAAFVGTPQKGCLPFSVNFYDSSRNTTKRYWDLNGDGVVDDSVANPIFKYTNPGLYDVKLTVYNKLGCPNTLTQKGFVSSLPAPTIKVSPNLKRICGNATVKFINNSLYYDNFSFDYGDGSKKDSDVIKPHFYSYNPKDKDSTIYITTTVMINNNGCKSTKKDTLVAYPVTVGGFKFSKPIGCAPLSIKFNDTSIYGGSRKWDFNSDGIIDDSSANPTHTFTPGIYSATMYAGSKAGCIDTVFKKNLITAWEPPIPDFAVSDTVICSYQSITFTNLSKSNQDTIASYLWKFDEPFAIDTSTQLSPTFTFFTPGFRKIKLTATDKRGCSTTITKPMVRVKDSFPPPNPEIYFVSVLDSTSNTVQWASNIQPTFSKYSLNRLGAATNPIYTTYNRNDTAYSDAAISNSTQSYCYNISATDDCNHTSTPLKKHCTIHLQAIPINGVSVSLIWSPYIGWDSVLSYNLYKRKSGSKDSLLATFAGGNYTYTDTGLCDFAYQYYVIAKALKGGFISYSNKIIFHPTYVKQDTALSIHYATVIDDANVEVSWKKTKLLNLQSYYLEKKETKGIQTPELIALRDTFYLDKKTDVHSKIYQYRVGVGDRCGNTYPNGSIGQTIHFITLVKDDKFYLKWNAYEDWASGVANYSIQLRNRDKSYFTIRNISGNDTSSIIDTIFTSIDTAYCFRVIAHEKGERKDSSVSNSSCAILDSRFFLPNAFTPGTDGLNDEWKPSSLFIYNATGMKKYDYSLKIFDRWGELVFESNDVNHGWDGKFYGQLAQDGIYIFILKANGMDNKSFYKTGNITLLRQ